MGRELALGAGDLDHSSSLPLTRSPALGKSLYHPDLILLPCQEREIRSLPFKQSMILWEDILKKKNLILLVVSASTNSPVKMCAEFLGLRQMCLLTFSQTLQTPDKYENKPTS